MEGARAWQLGTDVGLHKDVVLEGSNSHLQWPPMMLVPLEQVRVIFKEGVAQMVMVDRLQEILMVTGGNRTAASPKCRISSSSNSNQWEALANLKTQMLLSFSLVTEYEDR